MTSILLLEDNESLGAALSQRLGQEGYAITWARSLAEAKSSVGPALDLAIVDVGLPDGSGFEFARASLVPAGIPFVFLTAMNAAEDRLVGYELGGADYIPKPFHLRELLLRVRRVLETRRSEGKLPCGEFVLNTAALCIEFPDGTTQYPQARDFQLLRFLAEQAPRVVSRDEILAKAWNDEGSSSHRTVDNAVVRLRQLLGEAGGQRIRSVRGVGYQLLKDS